MSVLPLDTQWSHVSFKPNYLNFISVRIANLRYLCLRTLFFIVLTQMSHSGFFGKSNNLCNNVFACRLNISFLVSLTGVPSSSEDEELDDDDDDEDDEDDEESLEESESSEAGLLGNVVVGTAGFFF